jgi:two-component sensor histidine kinase
MWPPAARSVGRARRFLVQHLDAWGLPQISENAELVLSELVTNALAHAHPPYGTLIGVRVERLESGVRIEVHDANESKPERREASGDEESGRGLALVDALTGGHWGVSDRQGPGKLVWAMVRAPESGRDGPFV